MGGREGGRVGVRGRGSERAGARNRGTEGPRERGRGSEGATGRGTDEGRRGVSDKANLNACSSTRSISCADWSAPRTRRACGLGSGRGGLQPGGCRPACPGAPRSARTARVGTVCAGRRRTAVAVVPECRKADRGARTKREGERAAGCAGVRTSRSCWLYWLVATARSARTSRFCSSCSLRISS